MRSCVKAGSSSCRVRGADPGVLREARELIEAVPVGRRVGGDDDAVYALRFFS
jgi:hypothetical protein